MHSFADDTGKTWDIRISLAQIKKVRELTGWDLGRALADDCKIFTDICEDMCNVVDIVYALCKSQADKAGLTDVQFGERMAGDSVEDMVQAFIMEFASFCPSQHRQILMSVAAMTKAVQDDVMTKLNQTLSSFVTSLQGSQD